MPVVNSDKHVMESLEPWPDSSGKALARREEDSKDIIVDDLSATLEAHRASNRAAVIRNVQLPESYPTTSTMQPLLGQAGDGGSDIDDTCGRQENEPRQMWPADSVQAQEIHRKTGKRQGFVRSVDPLEYTGTYQWPKHSWKVRQVFKDLLMQRPWMAYMEASNEDYLERFVLEIY